MTAVWDLVIVGAGTAGIPAALHAADRGARVLVLESADRIGGTLHVSSGHMSAAGSRLQRSRGIADSPAEHFDDVMRICRGTADAAMVRLATAHAAETIDWLMDNGFDMAPECPVIAYSHEPYRIPRTYWGRDKARSILTVLARLFEPRVAAGDIALRLGTKAVGLARGEDHARQESGARWRLTVRRGTAEEVLDARTVLLASGGYGANPDLFARLTNGLPLLSPAPATADGSGLELALSLGGHARNGEIFLPTLGGVPETPGGHHVDWDDKAILTPQHRPPWEIFVNDRGERFVAEDNPSPDARERALKQQPGLAFWVVYDEAVRRSAPPLFPARDAARLEAAFGSHPAFVRADTADELAARAGWHREHFRAALAAYNAGVRDGRDALGRSFLPAPLAEPPFHAIRHQGVTLRCWAGIAVNERLEVVGQDGTPFAGLHAAGEILGGALLSGDSFASGMSITPALTFGRLLGRDLLTW